MADRIPTVRRDKGLRPICQPITLRSSKPLSGFILEPTSVGEYLRNRRLKAGLLQKDAAAILDVDPLTVVNWELGKTGIEVRFYPAIIALLGFNPLPEGQTLGERLRRARMSRGFSKKRLAALAEIDEATVTKLETDAASPFPGPKRAVLRTLDLSESE